MVEHSCSNTDGYSSPLPFIGLYTAGASLVCLLLMLWDMLFGLRSRYIPCRSFSLNSVTLTLLGVASKLPVDLTTNMPSARDQLSKLTGTTMICICMGFTMPSIATNKGLESIRNMTALSILVLIIIVNICIQLATGVIFSFFVEHIIILCFLLVVLLVMWYSTLDINEMKRVLASWNQSAFIMGEASLKDRVKRWYMFSNGYNPQLQLCREFYGLTAAVICVLCSLVFLQAAFRSLILNKLEFCEGVSHYGWSMWMIVITQIVTIIIGSLTIIIRWLSLVTHSSSFYHGDFMDSGCEAFEVRTSLMKRWSIKTIVLGLQLSPKVGLSLIYAVVFVIIALVLGASVRLLMGLKKLGRCLLCKTRERDTSNPWTEAFQGKGRIDYPEWIINNCDKDMKKWGKKRDSPVQSTSQMPSKPLSIPRGGTLLNKFQSSGEEYSGKAKYEGIKYSGYYVTCLSMVVLVKITVAFLQPSDLLTKSLRCTLDEAFKIIYYIDEKINDRSVTGQGIRELAKLLWEGGDLHISKRGLTDPIDTVGYAKSIVDRACQKLSPVHPTRSELQVIKGFINDQEYPSFETLRADMEQLFSEMLHFFLVQLPKCIKKEVMECPIEDCEERARFVTKFLYELNPSLEVFDANAIHLFDSHGGGAAPQTVQTTRDRGGSATPQNVQTTRDHGGGAAPQNVQIPDDPGEVPSKEIDDVV